MQHITIGSIVLGLFPLIWFFFHIKEEKRKRIKKANQKEKELLVAAIEAEKKQLKASHYVKKKEIFFQLNTDAIKLNLYPKSYFGNFIIARLYQEIVIANYYLDEPFHTEFSKLLQFIGTNELWIKDPRSREIIINTRDNINKICKKISMNVLDITEVLNSVVYKVYAGLKAEHIFTKKDIQNCILSASIFVLSKSGEIDLICEILGITSTNEKSLQYGLIDKICENFDDRTKKIIIENTFLEYIGFDKIYDDIVFNSYSYPYTFPVDEQPSRAINLLPCPPKKQLRSIAKPKDMFF